MINNIQGSQPIRQISAAKSVEPKAADIAELSEPAQKNVDEYVPSEEKEPIGLYEVERDEQGNSAVKFDAPKADPYEKTEQTTANTDNVDREIKSLKDERIALQRALRSASPDETEELQKQLEQIDAELALKDNDNYRRANAVFS